MNPHRRKYLILNSHSHDSGVWLSTNPNDINNIWPVRFLHRHDRFWDQVDWCYVGDLYAISWDPIADNIPIGVAEWSNPRAPACVTNKLEFKIHRFDTRVDRTLQLLPANPSRRKLAFKTIGDNVGSTNKILITTDPYSNKGYWIGLVGTAEATQYYTFYDPYPPTGKIYAVVLQDIEPQVRYIFTAEWSE